jgi:hypothetical protein
MYGVRSRAPALGGLDKRKFEADDVVGVARNYHRLLSGRTSVMISRGLSEHSSGITVELYDDIRAYVQR